MVGQTQNVCCNKTRHGSFLVCDNFDKTLLNSSLRLPIVYSVPDEQVRGTSEK